MTLLTLDAVSDGWRPDLDGGPPEVVNNVSPTRRYDFLWIVFLRTMIGASAFWSRVRKLSCSACCSSAAARYTHGSGPVKSRVKAVPHRPEHG